MDPVAGKPATTVGAVIWRTLLAAGLGCLMAAAAWAESPVSSLPEPVAENPRWVSVGGAITEAIYALGAGGYLVATDTTSYFPAEAEKTAKVGYQRALSSEGILSVKPDVLVLSHEAGPPKVLEQLSDSGLQVHRMPPSTSLEGVYQVLARLGDLLERPQAASALLARLKQQESTLGAERDRLDQPPRVLFFMQHGGGSPMVAGRDTAADSILTLSGAINAAGGFSGYKPLTPEAMVQAQPDFILTTEQGLQQLGGVRAIQQLPGVSLVPGGQADRIVAMDTLLLLGFGPRTLEAALQLNQHWQGFRS